ncbi:hypothetical protein B0A55_01555 [Friedmanniomyces simplex]|uniref:Uncharacterized protein n=1 Tax=Friedmanniomyces simplex TaxID=329884 RepID=A0A4U0Y3E6_9PEZI|nr:hypothetical protein B0A55_01555 [Friedmanniomyces simplex]
MAPKRKAAQAPSASQPLPASRTAGRKRRHSDASNASNASEIAVSSSQGANLSAPAKRRKGGKRAAASTEPEVIVEELEQEEALNAHHQDAINMQLGGDATYEYEMPTAADMVEDSIEVLKPRSKHVHFGGGAHHDGDGERSTATNLTPHPRKFESMTRRITMSPSVGHSSKRTASGSRMSLPPSWSQDTTSEPTRIIQELQFAPLRAVLDERVKRRLRRSHLSEEQIAIEDHVKADRRTSLELDQLRAEAAEKKARIEQLSYELETQRQLAIDVTDDVDAQQRVLALEQDLDETRRELAEHMEEHRLGGDHLNQNMLVLDSQEEIVEYPQLPAAPSSPFDVEMNGSRSARDIDTKTVLKTSTSGRTSLNVAKLAADFDAERQSFKDAIQVFSREAADARAELQVLKIELEALGFGGDDVSSKVILEHIRESFASVRESIETILLDTLPEEATSQDIIEILIANVKEFADRLRAQDQDLHEKNALVTDLTHQIEGLLEHLAEAEIKYKKLQEHWDQLDKRTDEQARQIEDLEEQLDSVEAERDALQAQVADRTAEAKELGRDHADFIKNIETLTVSLDRYRAEENRLAELITRMELEYAENTRKMNQEREETVQDLENRLDTEIVFRGEAEKQADDRQTEITQLNLQIEQISTERDALQDELQAVTAERDAEKAGRDTAEDSLEDRNAEVADLTIRVDRLEEELELMTAQVDELRKLNETGRHQREAAEQDLDDRNGEVDQLNRKLETQGQEANKLRMKLFEVQQQKDTEIKDLELQMSERDEQYQNDISEEVARREAADDLAAQRAAIILELETRIVQIELSMRDNLAERDERIEALEADVAARDTEIEGLKMDLRSAENDLDNERAQKEERIDELDGSIVALQATVSDYEAQIRQMQQQVINDTELHNSEIDDRNDRIAVLHAQAAQTKDTIEDLEAQKTSLEKRVEEEAEAMLDLQNAKEDEIEGYKAQLQDKQDKITVVESKAVQADQAWQEVLGMREQEIEELKVAAMGTEEVVVTLANDFEAMRQRFREYFARSTMAIEKLQAAVLTAKTVADDEGEGLKAEGLAALEEVEGYDLVGRLEVRRVVTKTATGTAGTGEGSGSGGKKGKGGRKSRRVVDSGIGIEAEEAMMG